MKVTIIDADSVAYRSAAASEERLIKVTHIPTGKVKEFKNRTELKTRLKEKGTLDQLDDYLIEDIQKPEPIANCLHTVKRQIEMISSVTEADDTIIVVGGKSSYREELPLPTKYKGNRDNMLRPIHLKEAKQYLINKFKAVEINGIESDDAVIVYAEQMKDQGHDVTIASIDKDSRQVQGFTIYDYSKEPEQGFFKCNNDTIQKIEKNGKPAKVTGTGIGFLAFQCLNGDRVDFYRPTELAGIKFGDVGAYNLLKDCKSTTEFLTVVKEQYEKWYPEPVTYTAWDGKEYTKDWKEILDMYFKCCYMLRSEFDDADSRKFFLKYGVDLDKEDENELQV